MTDKTPAQTGRKRKYVTDEELLAAIIEAKQLGRITDKLGKMYMLIAERFSRHPSFSRYSFRDDMVAFAVANLCANGLKFDENRFSKPFNYYTTAIYNSFIQFLAEEKKQRNIRDELLLEQGSSASSTYMNNAHDQYVENHREKTEEEKARAENPPRNRGYMLGSRKGRIVPKAKTEEVVEVKVEEVAIVADNDVIGVEVEIDNVQGADDVFEY
jgi:hypothetical protein